METQKLTTRIGKLLSGTRKPDEGFATIFAFEPKDFLEKQHGNLYFVIEIASGSQNASEAGEVIINSIKEEFYKDLNRNVLLSFESALRCANEELLDLASRRESDWIGKINVACAVLSGEKLHLSKAGLIEAYIVRGEKITHISEGLSVEEDEDKNKHPLGTFTTITSGSLEKHDKLVLGSPELLYHISLAGLKKIILENTPSGSVLKLKDLLKDEEGIGYIGLLIVEIVTQEELEKENLDEPDEIWMEEPKPTKAAFEVLAGIFLALISLFKNIFAFFKKSISSLVLKNKSGGVETQFPEASLKNEKEKLKEQEPKADKNAEEKFSQKSEKKESFLEFTISYFKKFSWKGFLKDIKRVFGNFKKGILEKMQSKYFKFFLIVSLLFLISLFFVLRNFYNGKTLKEVKAKLDQAVSLENKAESALIYDARSKAKEYLLESKSLTQEVLKTKYYNKEALLLVGKIGEALRKADGILEVSPSLVLELSKDQGSGSLTFAEKKIYLINSKNGNLLVFDTGKQAKEELTVPSPESNVSMITNFPSKDLVILLNDIPELFEVSVKNNKISKSSSKGGFKKGSVLASYQSNLYVLSNEDNQIYRFTKGASGWGISSGYLTDKSVDIKDAVSFTVPGTVYALKGNGEIIKLVKGKRQDFSIKDAPSSIKKPLKIQSNEGSDKIYVLDKDLGILVFNTNGEYIKDFTLKDTNDLKDFYVDESSKTIYLLSGNKVLSFENK